MKQIIFNADDFGMSEEVNEGIKKGIEAGMISNVSVMVNMPYFTDAINYLKLHPEVKVGLHFNITEGGPVLKPSEVGSLLREDNYFFYWANLIPRIFFHEAKIKDIENELEAQFKKLKKTGIKISYLDSNHHIHLYPSVFKIFLNFARQHNIKSIRGRSFKLTFPLFSGTIPSLKQLIITYFCIINSIIFNDKKDFFENDHLYDINWHPKMTKEQFLYLLDNISSGKTQIICHPGIISEKGNIKFLKPRQRDLSLLLDKEVQKKIFEYRPK